MTIASLELSKELFELSGWLLDYSIYWNTAGILNNTPDEYDPTIEPTNFAAPAYDLGYLLRKLPRFINEPYGISTVSDFNLFPTKDDHSWCSTYGGHANSVACADTPEDAACALAIELFKQEILKKEAN